MINAESSRKLSVKIFNSIKSIDRNKWDSGIEREDFYMRYDFLEITEQSVLDIHSYYYVMIFDKGVKVANIILFSVELDFLNLVGNSSKRIISKIRGIWKDSFFIKTLFCGLPISTVDNSIRILNEEFTEDVMASLDIIVRNIIKEEKIKITFCKDFTDNDLKWIKCMEDKSYKLVSGLPSNNLIIKWNSFEEYIGCLTKKYRNPLKKILAKRDFLDISVLGRNDSIFDDRFYSLYEQVNGASEFQLEKLAIDFFRKILNNESFSTKLIIIEKDGVLLGHVSIIESQDILIPLFLGYEKVMNKEYDIYFNLVYKILEVAIQEKKRIVKFGQTADFFKRKMGCTPVNVWWLIYITSPLIRPFTKSLFSKLFPKVEDYKFDIFKK